MILPLMLLSQAAPAPTAPAPKAPVTLQSRYEDCVNLATDDPPRGETAAIAWRTKGGSFFARQCLGIAYANQAKWSLAAAEFEGAASDAEVARDARAANYWAQAGNAWLAASQPLAARKDLDAALAAGTLEGLNLGEAMFDRGRALVALGDLESARVDIDKALEHAGDDPLIWLASATLARKMDDLPRARKDIAQAFNRSPDAAEVYLEIGNIAAMGGDEAGARSAWNDAARIAPSSAAAASARDALRQFVSAKDPPTR